MKKLILILASFLIISCSKKIEFSGKITGGSPLERIEFVESSGVATLPLANVGIATDGSFKGTFDAPKDGMYLMTYGGKQQLFYLKKGENFNLVADAHDFPTEYAVTGDAQQNNLFIKKVTSYIQQYSINVSEQLDEKQSEDKFIILLKRIQKDLNQKIDEIAKEVNPDQEVVAWKKNEVKVGVLGRLIHFRSQNPTRKISTNFNQYQSSLETNKDQLIRDFPLYRSFLLDEMMPEFQTFLETKSKGKMNVMPSQVFVEFLKDKKISSVEKDYLTAFIIAQMDISPQSNQEQIEKVQGIIQNNIQEKSVRDDLKKVVHAISGLKIGENAPNSELLLSNQKTIKISQLKGKPTVLILYSSWTPDLVSRMDSLLPMLEFYQKEIHFVAVNFDDTAEQFLKTSNAMMKSLPLQNAYAKGGLNSQMAREYAVYGFKLNPSFVILDKDGKIASRIFLHIGEKGMRKTLNQLSGLEFSGSDSNIQNDLLQR